MIIDDHNHPEWAKHNLDRFLENMEENGIDVTWILSWESPPDEYAPGPYALGLGLDNGPIPFSGCLSYVERAPDKFVLGYAPDPRRPEAIDQLAAAIDIYGVRVYGELKLRMMYDNPDALRMFKFCGEKGLPVLVHLDYEVPVGGGTYPRPNWWYGGGIEPFGRAVEACPETTFIGHGPGFWAKISNDDQYDKIYYPKGDVVPGGALVEMLRKYPNLYCDTSAGSGCNALRRDPEFGKGFVIEFQDRILHGRDCFDSKHQELLNSMGLEDEVLAKVYSKNALKLVPLGA